MIPKLPLVSVAMATFNGEQFLEDQLRSICNQTYRNLEVIVSDDCSTDGTVEILEEFNIKYGIDYCVNDKRLGLVRNFERALSLCRGEYIALADQDDMWFPEKIECLLNEIGDHSLISSDTNIIDSHGNIIAGSFKKVSNYIADTETPFLQLFLNTKWISGCTMLFKKELLREALPIPDGIGSHDWWFAIVATKNGGIKYLDRKLMSYRQHGKNISGNVKNQNLIYKFLRFFISDYRNKRKEFRNMIKKNIMITIDSNLLLEVYEKNILTDAILYFDSFITNQFDMATVKIAYKHREFLFSRRCFFALEIFYRLLNKLFKL